MFSWQDVCIYVISMASSHEQRSSVQRQLRHEELPCARVWPGVVLGNDTKRSRSILLKLADLCIVPHDYAEGLVQPELKGTVGSTIAHLSLMHHVHRHESCNWLMVLADDVCCATHDSGVSIPILACC